jgi:hypothetical protein
VGLGLIWSDPQEWVSGLWKSDSTLGLDMVPRRVRNYHGALPHCAQAIGFVGVDCIPRIFRELHWMRKEAAEYSQIQVRILSGTGPQLFRSV